MPYLDPSYIPTHIVPETGKCILAGRADGSDLYVSRGHFLLRAAPEGEVPVGVAVGVETEGVGEDFLPVQRQPTNSAVIPAVAGSQLLEQRGNTLVALG